MHVIYLYADTDKEWNCSEWRALSPANAINAEHEAGRSPHTAQLFYLPTALGWHDPAVQDKLGRADVLVFQRNVITPEVWAAMDYWRALGKIVLVDLDDSYPQLPPSNPAHQFWIRNVNNVQPGPVDALREGLRHADGLTSPSETLLDDWADIVPGFYVPNWTRGDWYANLTPKPAGAPDLVFGYGGNPPALQVVERPDSAGLVVIGWGGSVSHVDSWLYSGVIEALDRLFAERPNVRLKFCGGEDRLDHVFSRWGDRLWRQGGVRPEHWPQVVATFDIGIAPLDLRPIEPFREGGPLASYDERRSWLKGAEYLTAGVPWIATRCRTYDRLAHLGRMTENTPDAWHEALTRMIDGLPAHKAEAAKRRKWALKHLTLGAHANDIVETYARAAAVKATRAARLPGITYIDPQPVQAMA